MFCEGQLLPISEYETLFNLIGTTYGGDGQSTFALPDQRGRLPVHQGTSPAGRSFTLAETGGVEEVTLALAQIPAHNHALVASTAIAVVASPSGNVTAQPSVAVPYFATTPTSLLNASAVGQVGGSQPHENFQPYLCVNFIISLFGLFPQP
jgi:microcystin-dependent protein